MNGKNSWPLEIEYGHICHGMATVGNTGFYVIQQILRETNFSDTRNSKTAVLAIFCAAVNCYVGQFQPSKSAKKHKN